MLANGIQQYKRKMMETETTLKSGPWPADLSKKESTCHCSTISMLGIGSFQSDVEDLDIVIGFVCLGVSFDLTDVLHYLHSSYHSPKHGVLVVQPWL